MLWVVGLPDTAVSSQGRGILALPDRGTVTPTLWTDPPTLISEQLWLTPGDA